MRLQAATSRQCAPHCARSQQAGTRWAVAGWCRRQVEGKLKVRGRGTPHPWSPTLLHGCLRAVVEEEGSRRTPAKSPGGGGASRSERKRFAVQLMHAIILTMCCTITVETFRGQFNILSHVVPLFSFTELFTSWDVRGGEESLRTFCQSHPERNQK